MEEAAAWGCSALNSSTKTLAFTIAASVPSISNNCDSIFGGKDSLKCSNVLIGHPYCFPK